MKENKFFKILRLVIILASFALCVFASVELSVEAIEDCRYGLFAVVVLCLGGMTGMVYATVNIIKNWEHYWDS